MSKRQHHELENDAESGLTPAKRFTPLDAGESDSLASEKLEDLSSYLGLKDLSAEDGPKSLISTPFVDPEETSNLSDTQKQMLVEAITGTTARLAALLAKATRSQGSVMALRDLQVNWNLPEDRKWAELGAWKTVSRHTNQTLSRVANDLKKLKRRQHTVSQAPKAVTSVSLFEIFENAQSK